MPRERRHYIIYVSADICTSATQRIVLAACGQTAGSLRPYIFSSVGIRSANARAVFSDHPIICFILFSSRGSRVNVVKADYVGRDESLVLKKTPITTAFVTCSSSIIPSGVRAARVASPTRKTFFTHLSIQVCDVSRFEARTRVPITVDNKADVTYFNSSVHNCSMLVCLTSFSLVTGENLL